MRCVGAVAPPIRHGPLFFDGHSRRAEEQLAFHDKYHDRMARLTGGGASDHDAAWGRDEPHDGLPDRAPDYWEEYAKKLENLGLLRVGDDRSHAQAKTKAKSPPPRGGFASPFDRCSSPRRWETYSAAKSPTQLPEESVLHRLDWLAKDKNEPDTTDVINLLREVEEILVHEDSQRCDEPRVGAYSPPTSTPSLNRVPASHGHDPGRAMGVPPAPPIPTKDVTVVTANNNNMDANLTSTSRCRTAPPPTTPTAAPSFQHVSQGASSATPPQGGDWSQMSRYQQMEWYRTYYAWMIYYAQYYGSVLASQQQQQQQQQERQQYRKEKSVHKNSNKEQTSLKELSREYKKLALEVERLGQSFRSHASAKENASTQSPYREKGKDKGRRRTPPLYDGEDDYTLYRSDRGHSSFRVPHYSDLTPRDEEDEGPAPTRAPLAAAAPEAEHGSRAPLRRNSPRERGEFAHGAPQSNASEEEKALYGRHSNMPWLLPPQRKSQEACYVSLASRPTGRDISWLYRYEESETDGKAQSDAEEGGMWSREDEEGSSDPLLSEEGGRVPPPRSLRYSVQEQRGGHKERRSSVYERRKRELEQEKPRWCF
ncbi:hypothetical protein TRSC58_06307 [Trypanosoma rangeli SC58]|uniref:Uncharacterized protein n=1 Tax=Trypanosoma rangeli SC58 TaxID=429131 RepID=A0A061IVB1_TRYRA|nr:hypothetical protein TRSC58_06307 [Trypanosoma rangeli SC58]